MSGAYNHSWRPEIDISVSKLLGFETFANFLRVSVSVSENLVSEKKSRYQFRKIWYRKKSLGIGFGKFGIGKKSRYRFWKIWYRKKSLGIGFGKKVSVSVSVKILVSSFSALFFTESSNLLFKESSTTSHLVLNTVPMLSSMISAITSLSTSVCENIPHLSHPDLGNSYSEKMVCQYTK